MIHAWYKANGKDDDVILSTRVRLARNFSTFPFRNVMTAEQGDAVLKAAKGAVFSADPESYYFLRMDELSPVQKQSLMEKHLLSPEMLSGHPDGGLILSKDETVSIMINEEDHLRIQSLLPGLSLSEAWSIVNRVDDLIEQKEPYAFHDQYGYLTACPTNVGTGLRASVMVHLPALEITGQLSGLLGAVSKLGIAVRGLYGEGSKAVGSVVQLSNQITLGITEEETLQKVEAVMEKIIDAERTARERLKQEAGAVLEDKIWRSYGIFTHARRISSEEFMALWSDIRLGIYMGILPPLGEPINRLMVETQPAHIVTAIGRDAKPEERDEMRAKMIRQVMVK